MSKVGQFVHSFSVQAGIERTAGALAKRLPENVSVADLKKLAAEARDAAKVPNAFTDPRDYGFKAAAYELLAAQKSGASTFGK